MTGPATGRLATPDLAGIHDPPVDIAQDVALPLPPAGHDARQERGRDVCRDVMLDRSGHQAAVASSKSRVEPTGMIGGHVERLAQDGITALGRPAVLSGQARSVELGHEAAEGAYRGERTEPSWVAESAEVGRAGDGTDTRCRAHDRGLVGLLHEDPDALVELPDLRVQPEGHACLEGDVLAESRMDERVSLGRGVHRGPWCHNAEFLDGQPVMCRSQVGTIAVAGREVIALRAFARSISMARHHIIIGAFAAVDDRDARRLAEIRIVITSPDLEPQATLIVDATQVNKIPRTNLDGGDSQL